MKKETDNKRGEGKREGSRRSDISREDHSCEDHSREDHSCEDHGREDHGRGEGKREDHGRGEGRRDDDSMRFNPLIKARLEEMYRHPDEEDAARPVLEALLLAMGGGQILVPVELPENAFEGIDWNEELVGQTVTIDREMRWKLIQLTSSEGEIAMPVFTGEEKMDEAGMGMCSTFTVDLAQYMEDVAHMESVVGMLINPDGNSFFLTRDRLGALLELNRRGIRELS